MIRGSRPLVGTLSIALLATALLLAGTVTGAEGDHVTLQELESDDPYEGRVTWDSDGGSVADVGESCDETVLDGDSIQAAIDAASPGDTVCVGTGQYNQTVTISTDGIALVADGGARPIIEQKNQTVTGIRISGAEDVTVEGFLVRKFSLVDGAGINATDSPNVTIRDTIVENNTDGVSVTGSDGAVIEDVVAKHQDGHEWDSGIAVRDSDDVVIRNNTAYENGFGILHSGDNATIRGNVVYDNGWDSGLISAGLQTENGIGTVVADNHVYGNEETQILLFGVNESLVRNNTISEGGSTSFHGIDLRQSRDAIVEDNALAELPTGGIRINEGSQNATIRYNRVTGVGGTAIQFSSSDHGSVLQNDVTYSGLDGVRFFESSGGHVENNTIMHNDGAGIEFFGQGFDPSGDGVIRDNTVFNNSGGITVRDAPNTLVEDNNVSENRGGGVTVVDIDVGASGVVIGTNDIVENDEYGVRVRSVDDVLIDNATITRNGGHGVYLDDGAGLTVTNATIVENGGTGFYAVYSEESDTGSTVANSTIRYNWAGLTLQLSSSLDDLVNVSIRDTAIQEHAGHGIEVNSPAVDVEIKRNSIQHNGDGVVYTPSTGLSLNATENWWGATSGPSGGAEDSVTETVADGTGDSVSENVQFDPWLNAAPHAQPPRATFSLDPPFPESGETVSFTDESVHPDGTAIVDLEWRFGDGGSSTAQNPTHSYLAEGTYEVTLVVTDDDGLHSTATENVTVVDVPSGCNWLVVDDVTIQAVLDEASAGDTICIEDGTYEGGATIDLDGITLRAADGHAPVLDGGSDVDTGLLVTAWNATVDGLTFDGYLDEAVNATGGSNFTIEDATVYGTHAWGGVVVHDSVGATIHNSTFDGNSVSIFVSLSDDVAVIDNEFGNSGDAAFVESSSNLVLRNNTVVGNYRGFRVEESTGVEIRENDVRNGQSLSSFSNYGVDVTGGTNVQIVDNTLDAIDDGIAVTGADSVTIDGVIITDVDGYGIFLDWATATTINGTDVSGAGDYGVSLQDTTDTTIENTEITDNENGIYLRDSSTTTVEFGNLTGNGESVTFRGSFSDTVLIQNGIYGNDEGMQYEFGSPNEEVDARWNWWGHETGPSGDVIDPNTNETADGEGDAIVENVRFDPWLTEVPDGGLEIGRVAGEVTEADSNDPIEAATVDVLDGNLLVATTTTDASGAYSIDIEAGMYDLDVTHDDYQTATVDDVTVSDDETTTADVVLDPLEESSPGTIEGTITDNDTDDGVNAVTVTVLDGDTFVTSTSTDSDGTYSIEIEAGTFDLDIDHDDYESKTVTDVTVSADETTSLDVALDLIEDDSGGAAILASSLTHVDGTAPSIENISLNTFVAGGLLQIQLTNDTASEEDLEATYELAGLGVDATTEFDIEVQVENATPRVLVGSGNVSAWGTRDNGDGTTNVTITVRPVAVQSIMDCEAYGDSGCVPPVGEWPEGPNDTATVAQTATVDLAVDSLRFLPADRANVLNGTILATDAQEFGSPQYTPPGDDTAPALAVYVAAPHNTTDGAQNEGFYDALLPAALLEAWGLTSPGQLTAAYQGAPADFDAEWVDGNAQEDVRISIDLHYSAGVVAISASTDGGDDGGSSDPGDSGGIDPGSSGDDEPTATVPTPAETTTTTTSSPATASPTPADTPTASGDDTQTEPDDDSSTQQTTPSTQAPATTSTPGQPGFGLLVTVLALLAAFLIAGRRR